MSKAGRDLENKNVWHTILPSTRFREVEINPLNKKDPIWLVKKKSLSLLLMSLSNKIRDTEQGY